MGGVDYLLNQVGCEHETPAITEQEREEAHAGAEYLIRGEEHGETAGKWLGAGVATLGFEPGSAATAEQIRQVFGRLEDPRTGEQLGRKPYDYKSPTERLQAALAVEPNASPERIAELTWQATSGSQKAVGYFDLTYSPVKSVSIYYAALLDAGRVEEAGRIWELHREAVTASVARFEQQAGYSRAGYHTSVNGRSVGDFVAARNWVAARFDHSTNREHEPQLHSHVALLNRVQCEQDKEWRTLDGRSVYQAKRDADAVYELTLEQGISAEFPVQFAIREDGKAREIVGIDVKHREQVSTRTAQVNARVARQVHEYQERYGHAPEAMELTIMRQQATLHSRADKTAPMSREQLQQEWSKHHEMLASALKLAETAGQRSPVELDRKAIERAAIHKVQLARSTWTRADLMLAMKQQLPSTVAAVGGPAVEAFLTGMVDEALRPESGHNLIQLVARDKVAQPKEMMRESDGRSRFRPHEDERYCTADQLSAEQRLVATALAGGAPSLNAEQLAAVDVMLTARGLGPDQKAAVLGILKSERRGDVLLGPAGTGKSYATAALKAAWEEYHGPVIGLATAQAAANVLTGEGLDAFNVTAFLNDYEPNNSWDGLPYKTLPPGALLVIDETGMSATEQLDRVRQVAEQYGAKMLWTGDHEQLDSVGAGGALRLLVKDAPFFELSEVRRFENEWEKNASLAVRSGDQSALQEYDNRGRVFAGDVESMKQLAFEGYLADTISGKDSLLLVHTNREASEMSAQVRDRLVELGRVSPEGVGLVDGNVAGVGDLVQTRQNAWALVGESGRAVANRDCWTVLESKDGSLRAELQGHPETVVDLPKQYVAEHVNLAYASTSHSAQGRTVQTGHGLVDVNMTRGELYPNLTRGTEWNGLYVVTQAPPDDERGNEALNTDHISVLREVVGRDTAQHAAMQVMRDEAAAAESMATLGTIWTKVVTEQATDRYKDALLAKLGPEAMERIEGEFGTDRLMRSLREAELTGHNPVELVEHAVGRGQLDDADSLSDVLRYRVRTEAQVAPDRVPAAWTARTPDVDTVLGQHTRELAEAMEQRQAELGEQLAEEPPEWAVQHLGPVPEDPVLRADWTDRAGKVEGWRELAQVKGSTALGAAPSREEPDRRAAWHAAYNALGADEAGRDYAAATEADLQAAVDKHGHEKDWAPAFVAPQLGEASRRATLLERDAVLMKARLEVTPEGRERDELVNRQASRELLAGTESRRAEQLTAIHEARLLWADEHQDSAHAAEMSQRELDRRGGVDPDQAPVVEHNVYEASTTQADLDAAVDRAHAATERILEQRAERAEPVVQQDEPSVQVEHQQEQAGPELSMGDGEAA